MAGKVCQGGSHAGARAAAAAPAVLQSTHHYKIRLVEYRQPLIVATTLVQIDSDVK